MAFSDAMSWAAQSIWQAATSLSPTQATSPTFFRIKHTCQTLLYGFFTQIFLRKKLFLSALFSQGGYFCAAKMQFNIIRQSQKTFSSKYDYQKIITYSQFVKNHNYHSVFTAIFWFTLKKIIFLTPLTLLLKGLIISHSFKRA